MIQGYVNYEGLSGIIAALNKPFPPREKLPNVDDLFSRLGKKLLSATPNAEARAAVEKYGINLAETEKQRNVTLEAIPLPRPVEEYLKVGGETEEASVEAPSLEGEATPVAETSRVEPVTTLYEVDYQALKSDKAGSARNVLGYAKTHRITNHFEIEYKSTKTKPITSVYVESADVRRTLLREIKDSKKTATGNELIFLNKIGGMIKVKSDAKRRVFTPISSESEDETAASTPVVASTSAAKSTVSSAAAAIKKSLAEDGGEWTTVESAAEKKKNKKAAKAAKKAAGGYIGGGGGR